MRIFCLLFIFYLININSGVTLASIAQGEPKSNTQSLIGNSVGFTSISGAALVSYIDSNYSAYSPLLIAFGITSGHASNIFKLFKPCCTVEPEFSHFVYPSLVANSLSELNGLSVWVLREFFEWLHQNDLKFIKDTREENQLIMDTEVGVTLKLKSLISPDRDISSSRDDDLRKRRVKSDPVKETLPLKKRKVKKVKGNPIPISTDPIVTMFLPDENIKILAAATDANVIGTQREKNKRTIFIRDTRGGDLLELTFVGDDDSLREKQRAQAEEDPTRNGVLGILRSVNAWGWALPITISSSLATVPVGNITAGNSTALNTTMTNPTPSDSTAEAIIFGNLTVPVFCAMGYFLTDSLISLGEKVYDRVQEWRDSRSIVSPSQFFDTLLKALPYVNGTQAEIFLELYDTLSRNVADRKAHVTGRSRYNVEYEFLTSTYKDNGSNLKVRLSVLPPLKLLDRYSGQDSKGFSSARDFLQQEHLNALKIMFNSDEFDLDFLSLIKNQLDDKDIKIIDTPGGLAYAFQCTSSPLGVDDMLYPRRFRVLSVEVDLPSNSEKTKVSTKCSRLELELSRNHGLRDSSIKPRDFSVVVDSDSDDLSS